MSLGALKLALDRAGEASYCEGTYELTERLAIALPDGDLGAIDDATFVDWLLAHAEPAPFGKNNQTKVDKKVRNAQRLVARGKVKVGGFEPVKIMDEVENALSPTRKLTARLTDVIIYPEGGKFSRHKDTPRTQDLVGTLIVELPHAHEGGEFVVDDGDKVHLVDWSGKANKNRVRWVALFSDVDHEVKPVTKGSRITLVYSLIRTDTPRADAVSKARREIIRTAADNMGDVRWPVMIACSRQIIIEDNAWPEVSALKGMDRDIAEVFIEAGYDVTVRACMFASQANVDGGMPDMGDVYQMMRLKKPITKKAISKFDDILTFAETLTSDEGDFGDDVENMSLARFIDDDIAMDHWVFRARAEATMIHAASMFSDDGYFGNEAYEAFLYTLAALEVSQKTSRKKPARVVVEDAEEDQDDDDDDDDEDKDKDEDEDEDKDED